MRSTKSTNPLDFWATEIAIKYKITKERVLELYRLHDNNYRKVICLLEQIEEDKIPKITIYNNGILIKNKFYDFKRPENKELIEMLQRNEFDKDIFEQFFGQSNSEADIVIETRNDYYNRPISLLEIYENISEDDLSPHAIKRLKLDDEAGRYSFILGRGKVLTKDFKKSVNNIQLPPEISLGNFPTIKFLLAYKNEICPVTANEKFRIADVISYLKDVFGKDVYLMLGEEVLDENESIRAVGMSVVDIVLCSK